MTTGCDEVEQLRDRFERTKDRLENDLTILRESVTVTVLKMRNKNSRSTPNMLAFNDIGYGTNHEVDNEHLMDWRAGKRGAAATIISDSDKKNQRGPIVLRGAPPTGAESRSSPKRRNSLLDPTMQAFSKNVSDRRASSALATKFIANTILDKEENSKAGNKPSLRQLLTVDDKYRDNPPKLRHHTHEEVSKERQYSKKSVDSASTLPVAKGIYESDDLMAPPILREETKPKARHVKSYRKLSIDP